MSSHTSCLLQGHRSYVTCSNDKSRLSCELDFEKTPHKHCTMIFYYLEFLSLKYILISFLTVGSAYFSFILLFSTFYELLERLCMNCIKQNR